MPGAFWKGSILQLMNFKKILKIFHGVLELFYYMFEIQKSVQIKKNQIILDKQLSKEYKLFTDLAKRPTQITTPTNQFLSLDSLAPNPVPI